MTIMKHHTLYDLRRDNSRHEIKFISNSRWDHLIDLWLANNVENIKVHWPQRTINSIYFDDFNYSCYEENLSGASYREKLRLRWYGEQGLPSMAKLELKVKKNRLGWKFDCPISHFDGKNIKPFILRNTISQSHFHQRYIFSCYSLYSTSADIL